VIEAELQAVLTPSQDAYKQLQKNFKWCIRAKRGYFEDVVGGRPNVSFGEKAVRVSEIMDSGVHCLIFFRIARHSSNSNTVLVTARISVFGGNKFHNYLRDLISAFAFCSDNRTHWYGASIRLPRN
jgi:hypothetical protein